MSTLGQPHLEPSWKQEVNRRLAAHKSRKSGAPASDTVRPASTPGSRAAEAAARVAARYAKAPTYSQMQAEEARVAVRAAEIATKVALEAQAAAHSVLAELHAASEQTQRPPAQRGPAVVESIQRESRVEAADPVQQSDLSRNTPAPEVQNTTQVAPPITPTQAEPLAVETESFFPVIANGPNGGRSFDIRWEPDLPVRTIEIKPAPPPAQGAFDLTTEDWWTPAELSATLRDEPLQVEAQLPHANLIEFPRELVATRKMRPRLLEPAAAPADPQLSIFEVDPGAISTEPASAAPAREVPTREWSRPEWSGIELDAEPDATEVEVESNPEPHGPYLAPLGLRLLAAVVDGSLIVAAFFAGAVAIASHLHRVPAIKTAEAMALAGLLIAGLAYHAVFFGLGATTPGMKYAGVALSTFDDEVPTRRQLWRRFSAMLLSLLPVGLGFVWSVFDDDHLAWHDRISGTYLRKR